MGNSFPGTMISGAGGLRPFISSVQVAEESKPQRGAGVRPPDGTQWTPASLSCLASLDDPVHRRDANPEQFSDFPDAGA
jgi:hypothetical protein